MSSDPRPVRMAVTPRQVATVGLLALVPVLAWAIGGRGTVSAAVTGVNVCLIVASLVVAMRPTEGESRVFAP